MESAPMVSNENLHIMDQPNLQLRDTAVEPKSRYRLIPTIRYPAGKEFVLLYSQLGSLVRMMPQKSAERLHSCTGFLTVDEHARNLQSRWGGDLEQVRAEITSYVSQGFFISDREVAPASVQRGNRPQAKITALGIPTRDRPELLLRAVASYLDDRQKHSESYRLLIADGSDEDTSRNSLVTWSEHRNENIWYAGRREKQQYCRLLVNAGLPSEVVSFALLGDPRLPCAIGANRNALLLETLGETLVSVDDDSICQLTTVPDHGHPVLRFAGDNDAVHVQFFPDRASLLGKCATVGESLMAVHEAMIGRTLEELLIRSNGQIRIEGVSPLLLSSLKQGVGTVMACYLGVCGDSGMGTPLSFLIDRRGKSQAIIQSDADLRCALSSREVLLMARQPTISHAGPWLGNGVALDNRCLLPPFLPNLRGEDTVFGLTLATCFSDTYFAHLPLALLHDPPAQRPYSQQPYIGLSHVLLALIGATTTWFRGGSPDRTLRQLGNYLIEISSTSQTSFDHELRKLLLKHAALMLTIMDQEASIHNGVSALWRTEMDKVRDAVKEILQPDKMVPFELLGICSSEEAAGLTRELILAFGKLLFWWPEVSQAVRWLQSRGQRLAQPLTPRSALCG